MSAPRRRRQTLSQRLETINLSLRPEPLSVEGPGGNARCVIPPRVDIASPELVRAARELGLVVPSVVAAAVDATELEIPSPGFFVEYARPSPSFPHPIDDGPWIAWRAWQVTNAPTSLPTDGCLSAFIRLADANDDAILRFVQERGPLGVCSHGLPSTHLFSCVPRPLELAPNPFVESPLYRMAFEPLGAYRRFAHTAHMTVDMMVKLTRDERPSIEALEQLSQASLAFPDGLPPRARSERVTWGHTLVGTVIDAWLDLADIRVSLKQRARPSRWSVVAAARNTPLMACGSMFGTVAIQMAALLTSGRGVYDCDECGSPFTPLSAPEGRRPKKGQNKYCQSCRDRGYRHARRASREATLQRSQAPGQ